GTCPRPFDLSDETCRRQSRSSVLIPARVQPDAAPANKTPARRCGSFLRAESALLSKRCAVRAADRNRFPRKVGAQCPRAKEVYAKPLRHQPGLRGVSE